MPERGDTESERYAKRICQGCVVIEECAEGALLDDAVGIRAGMSQRQRRRMRGELRRNALVPVVETKEIPPEPEVAIEMTEIVTPSREDVLREAAADALYVPRVRPRK